MKMKMKLVLMLFLSMTSCKKNSLKDDSKKLSYIKTCIDKILETKEGIQISNCYIVNPYMSEFLFKEYSNNNELELFKKISSNQIDFKTGNDKENTNFLQKLTRFSKCENSYTILNFSLINNSIIYAELIDCKTEVARGKLTFSYLFNDVSQVYRYYFMLGDDGQVNEFLMDAIYYD